MNYQLIERYRKFLKKDYETLLKCRFKQFPTVIRIDDSYMPEKDIISMLSLKKIKLEKIPYLRHGYIADSNINITSTPEYLSGLIYIQSASSQIPAQVLEPKQGELILDMAAAPGSKLTQIAQLSRQKAIIVGLELQEKRMLKMHNNIERMKCRNIITYNVNALKLDKKIKFDKIILDAPCSGNLCLEKEWIEKRTIEEIKEKSTYQKKMFEQGIELLKSGGTFVYSSCSIEPEENEDIVEWALNNFSIKLEKIEINLKNARLVNTENKEIKEKCIRIWPHLHNTDAFFVAKFIKY